MEDLQTLNSYAAQHDKIIVIDFHATWCGPCKMIGPYFEHLSTLEEMKDVLFIKCDVDDAEDVAQFAGVTAMPTFALIKDGKLEQKVTGANIESVKNMIYKYIQ
jgi:thioredoxin 1